ncbi:phosphopantothenoylcysteine decarboxylase [Spiroplasma helicoides]|uniref:Coenzyme A biosynthesis bifunctional protein CoaBC n=1 Tax=Spiroplasma helicoides TaxID=216938 RepID=A0A1B3SKU2_9MOLU|nr:bifunctional phosphopantothenoylcysteine decarboxylase/phosphopantothenate--cysteine ligase CoaBC [Spiroplasma helicoides]AOG60551.1 phosphopantothenoylcysteine decarboxylase [Spiroplasma helicoides]
MKSVNLIVTGGIAASKSKEIYELLSKKYKVNIILSDNASKFVNFEQIKTISKIFEQDFYNNHSYGDHIKLAFEADLNVVYPASYNFIGQIANGLASNICSLVFAVSKSPLILFPSMNFNMYSNPILRENKNKLLKLSNIVWIEPKMGKMASGHIGIGRALEPKEVSDIVDKHFLEFKKFNDKKILINVGRARSWIDKVRYITNASSGLMGISLRNNAKPHFKDVKTIFGDTDYIVNLDENNIYAQTNDEMLEEMKKQYIDSDIVICSAALNDFEVLNKVDKKIEKRSIENEQLKIDLKHSVDVLKELGKEKDKQYLVGFSLANDFDFDKAWIKLEEKNLDMLIVNLVSAINAKESEIKIIIKRNKKVVQFDFDNKNNLAHMILKTIHDEI